MWCSFYSGVEFALFRDPTELAPYCILAEMKLSALEQRQPNYGCVSGVAPGHLFD